MAKVEKKPVNTPNTHKVFNPDGTLNGISYAKPSPPRGAMLMMQYGEKPVRTAGDTITPKPKTNVLTKSKLLDGKDFFKAYAELVDQMIVWRNLQGDQELCQKMHDSVNTFMEVRGLKTKTVTITYEEVFTTTPTATKPKAPKKRA